MPYLVIYHNRFPQPRGPADMRQSCHTAFAGPGVCSLTIPGAAAHSNGPNLLPVKRWIL